MSGLQSADAAPASAPVLTASTLIGCGSGKHASVVDSPRFVLTIGGSFGSDAGQFERPNGMRETASA